MNRFSPPVLAPLRSSASSWMYGGRSRAPNALPSAWTTPLRPSVNSYRQPRSRSIAPPPPVRRLKNPPPPCGRAFQFRLTRICPPTPPCFDSDTEGADLVSVSLLRETPDAGGGPEGGGPCGGGYCEVMTEPFVDGSPAGSSARMAQL